MIQAASNTPTPPKDSLNESREPKRTVRVGDLLVEKGLVTDEEIGQALSSQKDKGHKKLLGEVLIDMGFVTEAQVAQALAEAYGVPFANLNADTFDKAAIEALPREFIEKYQVMPLYSVRGTLYLAVHEPANVYLVEEAESIAGCPIEIVAATLDNIKEIISIAFAPAHGGFGLDEIVDGMNEDDLQLRHNELADISDVEGSADDSPVIKLVNYLLYGAVQEGASDIHMEPDDGVFRVRYRVDGRLYEKLSPPTGLVPAVVSRVKIMAGLDISERRIPQDGAISIMVDQRPIDLRVSTMPGKFGEKVVIRIIDKKNAVTSLDKIGFSDQMLEDYKSIINEPNGIILVTGPTGSGKSTTLYGTLADINNDETNISTVEDPVEYNLKGINQFQTHDKAGFTFAGALRALLRQDPDVIMVGEIRDKETAKIAIQAALTGHLVFSTLHTNDAAAAITRLFNIGVEPYLVAASIRGVLGQRLVRRICDNCKEVVPDSVQQERALKSLAAQGYEVERSYHGAGCKRCRETGYKGRLGIYELLIPNDECVDLITRGGTLPEIRAAAAKRGYTTLRDDGIEKVKQGLTTIEEVFRATAAA